MSTALADFVALSTTLVGAPLDVGEPLSSSLWQLFEQRVGIDRAEGLFQRYRALRAEGLAGEALEQALLQGDGLEARLARSVLKLWYLGVWNQPLDHEAWVEGTTSVVSVAAHRAARVWRVIESPPIGTGSAGFGSWARAPRSAAAGELDAALGSDGPDATRAGREAP